MPQNCSWGSPCRRQHPARAEILTALNRSKAWLWPPKYRKLGLRDVPQTCTDQLRVSPPGSPAAAQPQPW